MRDLGDLPDGFPVIAGSVGVSHGFVHVCEIGTPVTVFGLTVADGDLVHADRHGALVIPDGYLEALGDAIGKLMETEAIVLSAARRPGFRFRGVRARLGRVRAGPNLIRHEGAKPKAQRV